MKESNTSVYAAQASFFVITSAVPFISIILSVIGLFLPEASMDQGTHTMLALPPSSQFRSVFEYFATELSGSADISLLSIAAVAALWSSSKGISAVRMGIESVYRSSAHGGIIAHRLRSVLMTIIFIALIISALALLLFGGFILGMMGGELAKALNLARIPLLVLLLLTYDSLTFH